MVCYSKFLRTYKVMDTEVTFATRLPRKSKLHKYHSESRVRDREEGCEGSPRTAIMFKYLCCIDKPPKRRAEVFSIEDRKELLQSVANHEEWKRAQKDIRRRFREATKSKRLSAEDIVVADI